jgi:hypothetical protein
VTSWDPAKHFRGYHGRFAGGADRSEANAGGRGANAFRARPTAAQARTRKEAVPSRVRGGLAAYNKHERGAASFKELQSISWASPKKIIEQRAKTGDSIVPRSEFIAHERHSGHGIRSGFKPARTDIAKTFTGKKTVVRGNYRELIGPDGKVKHESRVRRNFDLPKKSARKLMAAKPTEYVGRRRAAG